MTLASYNVQNQVTGTPQAPAGYAYDNAGDVTNDGKNQYLYDAEGRLCAVYNDGSYTGYLYDAAGNRVAKGSINFLSCDVTSNGFQQTAGYVVGPSGEQLTEVDGSGNWVHTNVYAGGKLIGTYDGNVSAPTLHFYFDDPLGTRRAQTDASGNLEAVYQSLPFGDGYAMSGNDDPTENHYTGKERDTESGNDDFGARYYNSATGRWLSPDWIAFPDTVPYANYSNPQTLNLYAYTLNNPLGLVDEDGHDGCFAEGMPADCGVLSSLVLADAASEVESYADNLVDALLGYNERDQLAKEKARERTGNIVYNETGGLRPETVGGSGSSQDLHDARVAIADVINNRANVGTAGGVASDQVGANERNTSQYEDAQSAASEAADSPDVTGGSKNFYLDYGQKAPSWAAGKQTTTYGPFKNAAGGGDVPKGTDVKIIIVHPENQQ